MAFELAEEEWKELRSEVLGLVAEARQTEKLAVGASGAVYAWLSTHPESVTNFGVLPWYIPMLFAVLGSLRSWALGKQIGKIAEYLHKLESELGKNNSNGIGWEQYFSKERGHIYWSSVAFWAILLSVTALVPWVVQCGI